MRKWNGALIILLGLFLSLLTGCGDDSTNSPISDPVMTADGYVSGTVIGDADDPVRIYRGIPYAAPPVGNLRWAPPQSPAKWSGVRECVDYSTYPVQFLPGRYYPVDAPQSEDSLYLNVLTPAKYTNEKLPVIVWFHGGGLSGASGNDVTWNNYRLPQHGVALVTVNMRLGALGFLAHPELTAEQGGHSGNYMFLDMVQSLKWVKANIEAFGGNADNVTILGESGGGAKVSTLLASPQASGLFNKAIVQSGGYIEPKPLVDVETYGEHFFEYLGVNNLEEARAKPWQDIVAAYVAMQGTPAAPGPYAHPPEFGPAIDGWFLTDTVRGTFLSHNQNAVPIIVQSVAGELHIPGFMPEMIDYYQDMLNGNRDLGVDGYAAIFNQVPANWAANGITSFHALDLAYTFGFYDDPEADMWQQMTARTNPHQDPPALGEDDRIVSEDMMTRIAQFAKTGNPNTKGSLSWPVWTPTEDKYMYWDKGSEIKTGFSGLQ